MSLYTFTWALNPPTDCERSLAEVVLATMLRTPEMSGLADYTTDGNGAAYVTEKRASGGPKKTVWQRAKVIPGRFTHRRTAVSSETMGAPYSVALLLALMVMREVGIIENTVIRNVPKSATKLDAWQIKHDPVFPARIIEGYLGNLCKNATLIGQKLSHQAWNEHRLKGLSPAGRYARIVHPLPDARYLYRCYRLGSGVIERFAQDFGVETCPF